MVKPYERFLERSIKITKFRIKHHEKHGCGNNAMEDKRTLVKQEKIKENRKIK